MRLAACLVAIYLAAGVAMANANHSLLSFSDLNGWASDDHRAAMDAFLETCADIDDPEWLPICAVAQKNPNPKLFFETFFQPVLIEDGEPMLFTGYFEPELNGSLQKTGVYQTPLYRLPPGFEPGPSAPTRKDIEQGA